MAFVTFTKIFLLAADEWLLLSWAVGLGTGRLWQDMHLKLLDIQRSQIDEFRFSQLFSGRDLDILLSYIMLHWNLAFIESVDQYYF